MEEVIDRLRAVNESVPVPLELPTFDQFVAVQEALLIHIPDDYRDFLFEVSDVVYGNIEPATIADDSLHTYLPEITSKAWAEGLERNLLPICQVGSSYYVIDEQGEVTLWPEQDDASWSSIWHWARSVWLGEAGEVADAENIDN